MSLAIQRYIILIYIAKTAPDRNCSSDICKEILSDINDNKAKIEFLSFREEIEQRIIELDEFYQLNINDSRIGTFEKVRNRLASLLEINIDEGNKIIQKKYGKNNEISLTNMNKFKFNQKNTMPKKSKLFMSSSAMRHSSVRKSGSLFGE